MEARLKTTCCVSGWAVLRGRHPMQCTCHVKSCNRQSMLAIQWYSAMT